MAERRLNRQTLTLLEAFELFQQGKGLPETVALSLKDLSQKDVLAILEIARVKSFGSDYASKLDRILAPPTGGRMGELRLASSLVEAGCFVSVLERLGKKESSDPELAVQEIRAKVFTGNYVDSQEDLRELLALSELTLESRGICHQILGHCLLELGDFKSAIECFEIAGKIAESLGDPHAMIAARLFQVKTRCLLDDQGGARAHFKEALLGFSKSNESFRWLIGLYRTWFFLLFSNRDRRCFDKAFAALDLARAIEDRFYFLRTATEILLAARSFGLPARASVLEAVRSFAARDDLSSVGDARLWLGACLGASAVGDLPMSLKYFLRPLSPVSVPQSERTQIQSAIEREIQEGSQSDFAAPAWLIDREQSWLIDLQGKTHRTLQDGSPHLGLIEVLNRSSTPLPMDSAFSKAWGIPWKESIHANTIGVAMARINTRKPSYLILRKANQLSLLRSGRVI